MRTRTIRWAAVLLAAVLLAWSWSAEAATTQVQHIPWAAHLHIGVYVRMRRSAPAAGLCAHELYLSFPQFSFTRTPHQCNSHAQGVCDYVAEEERLLLAVPARHSVVSRKFYRSLRPSESAEMRAQYLKRYDIFHCHEDKT